MGSLLVRHPHAEQGITQAIKIFAQLSLWAENLTFGAHALQARNSRDFLSSKISCNNMAVTGADRLIKHN